MATTREDCPLMGRGLAHPLGSLGVVLRYLTAGESHGQALVVIVEGLPAGLPILIEDVGSELARRRLGYGRAPLTMVAGNVKALPEEYLDEQGQPTAAFRRYAMPLIGEPLPPRAVLTLPLAAAPCR